VQSTAIDIHVGGSGFLAFGSVPEIEMAFEAVGRFKLKHEIPLVEFTESGFQRLRITDLRRVYALSSSNGNAEAAAASAGARGGTPPVRTRGRQFICSTMVKS